MLTSDSIEKVLILAVSWKHGGYCVAGKLLRTGEWVRLVADENSGAISKEFVERFGICVGKLYLVPFGKLAPLPYQPENVIVIANAPWQNAEKDDAKLYADTPDDLWGQGEKTLLLQDTPLKQSLYLVKVTGAELYMKTYDDERVKLHLRFVYNLIEYDLNVTYKCNYSLNRKMAGWIVVSLGMPYNGYHYKLVVSAQLREITGA